MQMTSQIFHKNFDSDTKSLNIINIFTPFSIKDTIMQNASQKAEAELKNNDKKKDDEIFQMNGEVKKKKKKDKHFMKTTLNALHDNYMKHNMQEDNKKNLEVLNFAKRKMMGQILNFTNTLVSDDLLK